MYRLTLRPCKGREETAAPARSSLVLHPAFGQRGAPPRLPSPADGTGPGALGWGRELRPPLLDAGPGPRCPPLLTLGFLSFLGLPRAAFSFLGLFLFSPFPPVSSGHLASRPAPARLRRLEGLHRSGRKPLLPVPQNQCY